MGKDYSSGMENPLGQRLRELPGPLLLTGHTGFKGTWMTFLLEHLNVQVVGYSLEAEKDSLYDRAERTGAIPELFGDIRDYEALEQFIDLQKPSTIIHMAAQPLVLESYESPRETFDVNVMGTVNLLDIAFKKDFVKAIIVVTTDKVYRNDNSGQAFVESDPLEGKDPYSASKVGTEAVVSSWQQIAKVSGGPKVVSVRAGNVIGGGDFADNRIIPDIVRGVISNRPIELRNPNSIRPWQHVLDSLKGYILMLESANEKTDINTVNFGPAEQNLTVLGLSELAKSIFSNLEFKNGDNSKEASTEFWNLNLNSKLAKLGLGWESKWSQEESIIRTFKWWQAYVFKKQSAQELCKNEIIEFLN
jgi:CDP-glucose 4,6-dehydratase